ncbi:uncharacterized protein LOC105426842 [Pogonomyrmex barbatus]|uniref:Uncharacterized protein LOC105426842 n=1 Tax=Pogonomyrmex barbatus TaxID=144034 RepID=A0A6I9W3V3_9HYME|nr:uncharacterized protein LOC105426842 [Pogonomyrmex barbatus]
MSEKFANMRKEFYNANVQKFLKKYNINHYSTYSMKVSVIERFYAYIEERHGSNLCSTETINGSICCRVSCQSTTHENIELSICDPFTPAIADKFLTTVYSRVNIAAPARFKVGDSIRVSKFKTTFEKDYTSNWTTEIFKIIKVPKTNPVTYLLENYKGKPVAGGFYEYELHRH